MVCWDNIYIYIHSIWYMYMVYRYVAASVMPTTPIHWSQWLRQVCWPLGTCNGGDRWRPYRS